MKKGHGDGKPSSVIKAEERARQKALRK